MTGGLIVTEWIETSGGAERVLESMGRAFPDADIQCLWNDAPGRFTAGRVHETWLARTPFRAHKALALPLMSAVWRGLRPKERYDWMLVSSYVFAHHARLIGQHVPKYVYAHTPARYIWNPELDARGNRALIGAVSPLFRWLDHRRAQEATAIAANSDFVRDRIARAWGRDATVIYPPVAVDSILSRDDWREAVADDAERRLLDELPPSFVLGASRFTPYKKLGLVIATAEGIGLPAVIVGRGPAEAALRARAAASTVPVHMIVAPSDALLYALMQRSSVFVFPPVEDFGIVPVEAQAAGTPVVTGPVGGQVEALTPGVSGIVADSFEAPDLAAAAARAIDLPKFDALAVTARFREAEFVDRIRTFVGS